jgi:hypothetical protein
MRSLFFVRAESFDGRPARQRSIVAASMSSTAIEPNAGSKCAAIVER